MRKFRVYAPKLINSRNQTIEEAIPIYGGEYIRYIEIEANDIGDEYHTLHDLYEHRMALTIALFHAWNVIGLKVMKSKLHHDGTMFEGDYFIVMAITACGQISYHYKMKHWDKFKIPEVERTPEYDGHKSIDVFDRLIKA